MHFQDGSYLPREDNRHWRTQPPPPGLHDWIQNAPDHILKELVELVETQLRARAQRRREEQERNYPPTGCVRGFVGLLGVSGSVIGFPTTSKQPCTIMLASGIDAVTIGVNDRLI